MVPHLYSVARKCLFLSYLNSEFGLQNNWYKTTLITSYWKLGMFPKIILHPGLHRTTWRAHNAIHQKRKRSLSYQLGYDRIYSKSSSHKCSTLMLRKSSCRGYAKTEFCKRNYHKSVSNITAFPNGTWKILRSASKGRVTRADVVVNVKEQTECRSMSVNDSLNILSQRSDISMPLHKQYDLWKMNTMRTWTQPKQSWVKYWLLFNETEFSVANIMSIIFPLPHKQYSTGEFVYLSTKLTIRYKRDDDKSYRVNFNQH